MKKTPEKPLPSSPSRGPATPGERQRRLAEFYMAEILWRKPTPDTPAEAASRARLEAELRARKGQEYMDRHKALLDAEWEYIKVTFGG